MMASLILNNYIVPISVSYFRSQYSTSNMIVDINTKFFLKGQVPLPCKAMAHSHKSDLVVYGVCVQSKMAILFGHPNDANQQLFSGI